jgi:hypothetical protein
LTVRDLSAQSRLAIDSTQGLPGFWEGMAMRTTLRVWLTGFPRRLARQALILDVADHRAALKRARHALFGLRPTPLDATVRGGLTRVPETFSERQACLVLDLATLHLCSRARALHTLHAWEHSRLLSPSQAECIAQMLLLDRQDFLATLADAMEPCALRHELRVVRHHSRRGGTASAWS